VKRDKTSKNPFKQFDGYSPYYS